MKRDDILRLSVFEHGKRVAVERIDNVLLVVDHRGVQQNFVHVLTKDENSLVIEIFVLTVLLGLPLWWRRRHGSRWRRWRGRRRCRGLVILLRRGRLRPGGHRQSHHGPNQQREEKNPRDPIP